MTLFHKKHIISAVELIYAVFISNELANITKEVFLLDTENYLRVSNFVILVILIFVMYTIIMIYKWLKKRFILRKGYITSFIFIALHLFDFFLLPIFIRKIEKESVNSTESERLLNQSNNAKSTVMIFTLIAISIVLGLTITFSRDLFVNSFAPFFAGDIEVDTLSANIYGYSFKLATTSYVLILISIILLRFKESTFEQFMVYWIAASIALLYLSTFAALFFAVGSYSINLYFGRRDIQ